MIFTREEAKKVIDKALSYAKADETEISLSGGDHGNLRFARNIPTTSGGMRNINLNITSVFGKKVGSYSTTQLDDASVRKAVERAEQMARLSPENAEYMPRLGPQEYLQPPLWDGGTSGVRPEERADIAAAAIEQARAKSLVAAGYIEHGASFTALGNSRGLFGYYRSTSASYTLTVRTEDGSGSGWAAAESFRQGGVDARRITERAIAKAIGSQKPTQLDPGTYPVVLEPSPVGDMINLLSWNLDRRAADEGRSYFSDPAKGTKIGEKLFSEKITIYSDPMNPIAPGSPWGGDGTPTKRTMWVEKGVLKNLSVGRYWAREKGLPVIPWGPNMIMEGEDHSIDDLVASTDYGLLVTSFWYIRQVDPKTILFTGLTRDGVFLIEKGKITRPVINFRWNESPAALFKGVEMMSRPERVVTREGNAPMIAPAMKVKEFHFTSASTST